MKIVGLIAAGMLAAGFAVAVPGEAEAQSKGGSCVTKGGRGTGSTVDSARFQAWEAVLQATSWPMWSVWITSGAKVGQAASGYRVSNVKQKCGNGGALGKECVIFAKLCS